MPNHVRLLTIVFAALFTFSSSNDVFTQNNHKKLESLFTQLHQQGDFNGTVLVAQGEKIVFKSNYGYADFEKNIMINDSTVFELASLGKPFTAIAIMILKEQGKLKFDDKITSYLPEMPYDQVTIKHLLTMTSGIPDYLNFSNEWDPSEIATNKDVLAYYIDQQPGLLFNPEEQFHYANINYVLLAEIIKTVSGRKFSTFLKQYIFDPAGMSHTRSYNQQYIAGQKIANYAIPHIVSQGNYIPTDQNESTQYIVAASGIEGDGSIVSTAEDLFKWNMAMEKGQLVSPQTMEEAYTINKLTTGKQSEYGFGMYTNGKKIWHWGGWPGIQTAFTKYLKNGNIAIYLKNVETNNWSWLRTFEKLIK